jgi:hypothetical protein
MTEVRDLAATAVRTLAAYQDGKVAAGVVASAFSAFNLACTPTGILAICEERDRLREAITAMRSLVHNLPRCVTADRIDAIAGAALGATP